MVEIITLVQLNIFLLSYAFLSSFAKEIYPTKTCSQTHDKEIFDLFSYSCVSCGFDERKNLLIKKDDQCICQRGYKTISRKNKLSVNCEKCSDQEEVTQDKLNCIKPGNCTSNEIKVEYNTSGQLLDQKTCYKCVDKTQPNADKTRCIPCPVNPLKPNEIMCSSPCSKDYVQGQENIVHPLNEIVCKCEVLEERHSCSCLHNQCVLEMYDMTKPACKKYDQISKTKKLPPPLTISPDDNFVSPMYSFLQSDPHSKLKLKLARYSLNGSLIAIEDASMNSLQICYMPCERFSFGSWFMKTCSIRTKDLWNSWTTEFYELFLQVNDDEMTPIPVNIEILKSDFQKKVFSENFRRFFLVANINESVSSPKSFPVVHYAKSIKLKIQFKDDIPGKIYLPTLTIMYSSTSQNDLHEKMEFSVEYWKSSEKLVQDVSITLGVFSVFAIIFSGVQTWSWCKRSGKLAIDFFILGKFMLYLCSQLANVFLLVIFFVSLLSWLFYKNQRYPVIVLPTKDQERLFQSYIIAAFCLKCFDIIHVLNTVINTDLFFIDWERPRLPQAKIGGVTQEISEIYPVSIWRSYFIANEWNKLKVLHKTNTLINLCSVIFFLKLLKLENLATAQPDSDVVEECGSPFSQICRFALVVVTFFTSALIQYIIKTFFYEKLIVDSKLNQLKDLCSVANISIFVLIHRQYGYYIHGRSVHGHADVDMKIFNEYLKREEENVCGLRGLLPNTSLQTFSIFVTRDFFTQYNKIKFYNKQNTRRKFSPIFSVPYSHTRSKNASSFPAEKMFSYQTMNKFLSTFIDHALQDLDYVVKDKLISERMIDIEFEEPSEKSFFYNDRSPSIHYAMLSGHETSFLVWEVLMIAVLDILSQDFLQSAFFTAIAVKILERIYLSLSRRNLIMNTLLDGRFLPS